MQTHNTPERALKSNSKLAVSIGQAWGISPDSTLVKRLAERRITPEVISTFDIQTRGDGWTYPTPRGALRFKHADPDAAAKYAWMGDKRDTLLYAFDLQDAIQLSGGDVWLTTEFDFFAMRSAGIFHVIAQLQGEGSVPDELAAMLQSLGALACHVAPDRDEAGQRWAQLVADKLTPAGIEVYARELPFPHTEKHGGDIGLLWQQYSQARPFERYLLSLPVTQLKPSAPAIAKPRADYEISGDRKADIARALGVFEFGNDGYSKPIKCPFHDDHTPSAGLHKEFGLHCFTEGKWYRWKDLSEILGLEWQTTTAAPVYHLTLGREVAQALVRLGASALANTLNACYAAGWQPGQRFTIKDLTALVPQWRARKAFSQMAGEGLDLRKQNARGKRGKRIENMYWELTPLFFTSKEALILNKYYPGQPAKRAKLPSPAELERALNVKATDYEPIAHRDNLADWRAEVYARPIDADPGSWPRQELCKPLGISTTTAQAYDRRAGVTVMHKTTPRQALENDAALPDTPILKAAWLETEDGRRFSATKAGYARACQHAKGGRVFMVKQLANEYHR